MEKSIENIWKEGFIKNDALVAPKLNELYNRKSEHFISKYKRTFRLNINWIVIGSSAFLIISYIIGIPVLGVAMFVLLNIMALVDKKLLDKLNKVDYNETSYDYLKSFLNWWDLKTKVNIIMARILYPYVFIFSIVGLWFMKIKGDNLGTILTNYFVAEFPSMQLVFGMPLVGVIGVALISILLLFFSDKIYKWDINLVYGRVLEKIKTLVKDMEELRN